MIFRKQFASPKLSSRAESLIIRISASTLFVYLIHMLIIRRLQIYLHLYTTDYNVLFSVPLMALLVFCLSSVIGMVLERIPLLNRIL